MDEQSLGNTGAETLNIDRAFMTSGMYWGMITSLWPWEYFADTEVPQITAAMHCLKHSSLQFLCIWLLSVLV